MHSSKDLRGALVRAYFSKLRGYSFDIMDTRYVFKKPMDRFYIQKQLARDAEENH